MIIMEDRYFGTCDQCGCRCGNKKYGWKGNTNVKIKQAYLVWPFNSLEQVTIYLCEDCVKIAKEEK